MKNTQLLMEWLPHNYLKLMIQHHIKIDMRNYPGGKIVEPKKANVKHLQDAIDGWENGKINWIELTAEEFEQQKEELSSIDHEASKANLKTGSTSKSGTMYVACFRYW